MQLHRVDVVSFTGTLNMSRDFSMLTFSISSTEGYPSAEVRPLVHRLDCPDCERLIWNTWFVFSYFLVRCLYTMKFLFCYLCRKSLPFPAFFSVLKFLLMKLSSTNGSYDIMTRLFLWWASITMFLLKLYSYSLVFNIKNRSSQCWDGHLVVIWSARRLCMRQNRRINMQ